MFIEANKSGDKGTHIGEHNAKDHASNTYFIVYGVLAFVLVAIIIDLWFVVDPRIPQNNPYYLMKTDE